MRKCNSTVYTPETLNQKLEKDDKFSVFYDDADEDLYVLIG